MNCVNDVPQLLRCDSATGNHWIKMKLIGTKSNRSAIGAACTARRARRQMDEVRSGGSYLPRAIFACTSGLGKRRWRISRSAGRAGRWRSC